MKSRFIWTHLNIIDLVRMKQKNSMFHYIWKQKLIATHLKL